MLVELPYSLRGRYGSIAVAWTVIVLPPVVINLALFYGLWYGRPEMDRILVLTLPTAILGIFTVIAIVERVWKLVQPSPRFRPLNSPRYALDVFQWGYFLALIAISALITSTLARDDNDHDHHEYQIRLMSLPASLLMYLLATLTLASLALNELGWKVPFRLGSLDAGNVLRPAVFYVVEDIVAVDGNGGSEFREAFVARYGGSDVFRRLIWWVSVAWMVFFYTVAALTTAMVLTLPKMVVYAVGWTVPFPLSGIMAIWTIYFVKRSLRIERETDQDNERAPLLR